MFGFFEAADGEVAARAAGRGRSLGRGARPRRVRGPISPSLNEMCGLLIDGFDTDPMLLMPHNPPEYGAQIEVGGLRQGQGSVRVAARCSQRELPPVFVRAARRLRDKHGITIRPLNLGEFTREVERLRAIYCTAWERNWGFVAPTDAEFRRIAKELKPIFDPRCTVCAEVDGEMVACLVAVPDINQALKGTSGRLFPLGSAAAAVAEALHHAGPPAAARHRRALSRAGAVSAADRRVARADAAARRTRAPSSRGCSRTTATSTSPAEAGGARRYKTYRLYEKAL